jgi:chromate transport protein ChrA
MIYALNSIVTSKVQQTENGHDEGGSEMETRTAGFGQTILEPFLVFLRLGLTSFGGPIAHLGYFRHEFVERRKWLSEQAFADLVALCNFLPGPTSSQVSYSIGMTRGGIPGAISAWSAFTLPSTIIMLLAAYGIHWISGGHGASWLHGLKVVAVAVVAQASLVDGNEALHGSHPDHLRVCCCGNHPFDEQLLGPGAYNRSWCAGELETDSRRGASKKT